MYLVNVTALHFGNYVGRGGYIMSLLDEQIQCFIQCVEELKAMSGGFTPLWWNRFGHSLGNGSVCHPPQHPL